MNLPQIILLAMEVSYKDWQFNFGVMGDGSFVQVRLPEINQETGKNWTGRKWYISSHATEAEVITTMFKAVITAEEHETREQFLFKGKAIFGPHLSLDALVANADQVAIRMQPETFEQKSAEILQLHL